MDSVSYNSTFFGKFYSSHSFLSKTKPKNLFESIFELFFSIMVPFNISVNMKKLSSNISKQKGK